MQIRAKTIAEAHVKVCKAIEQCEDRNEYISEDNELVFEYPEPVLIIVEEPISEDMVSSLCKFGVRSIKKYRDDLLNGTDSEFVYTYHDRLFKYNVNNDLYYNQIGNIIKKLKKEPLSRRAQAITWYPETDLYSDNPPCLQRIQFLIRDGKLNMDVNFRSNDCLSAIGQNMYAFAHLQKMVARELGIEVGIYTHYITSAHFYPKRDAEEYNELRSMIYK